MGTKNSGFIASGPTQPGFMNGDIYRDKYGGTVMIKGVVGRRITYRRERYSCDYVMSVYQFQRDSSLVYAVPRGKPISREKAWGNIQKMKTMINEFGGEKWDWHRMQNSSRAAQNTEKQESLFLQVVIPGHARNNDRNMMRVWPEIMSLLYSLGSGSYLNWIVCKLCRKAEDRHTYAGPDILHL